MSIVVRNLRKSFIGPSPASARFVALAEASFSVADGEFVTMLGPSGSGKSTILRCVAGLENPDEGRIEINGEDVTHIPVQDRKVGFVFQHYALFRHMTVLENISFGLLVRGQGKKEREARADNLLDLVGLKGYGTRMPSQLSGGQRQRVALARALAPEPRRLLLDEPFGALDTRLRKELRAWLRKLHDRIRLTTLLVTHDQDEAFELSDRVIVTNRGRIEQDGTPREIFDKPATEFVAAFVGDANRIEGRVSGGRIAWGDFRFGANGLEPDAEAVVLFRPSDVYVASEPARDTVPGLIRSIQYLGATAVLEILCSGDRNMTAQMPKGVAGASGFAAGGYVHVQVTEAHVFRKPGASPS